jgi:hypothetical protein
LSQVEDFLPYLYLTSPGLEKYAEGAPLNTDDNARIEFNAPLNLYAETGAENIKRFAQHRVDVTDVLQSIPTDRSARREMHLALSETLLRLQRYWAADDELDIAEEIAEDARTVRLRALIDAKRRPSSPAASASPSSSTPSSSSPPTSLPRSAPPSASSPSNASP